MPRAIIIAGPDGAGKTTFAREFLPSEAGVIRFLNADLIPAGLAHLGWAQSEVRAGKILFEDIDGAVCQGTRLRSGTTRRVVGCHLEELAGRIGRVRFSSTT